MPEIETDKLAISYADTGPRDGPVVLLLHGWPDDAGTWDKVAPALNAAGLRTVVPTLRGFGATRFLHGAERHRRTGDSGILAMDAIDLMDALGIERFMLAGHDWGVGIGEALAVGWPGRVERLALLSSPMRLGGMATPSFEQAQRYWYHWFQATRRGQDAVRADPRGFARLMWVNWSPPGWFEEEEFARVARSFDNPDWVDVTLHSYQARWGEAEPDPESAALNEKIKATQRLPQPALVIQGMADGVNDPKLTLSSRDRFSGPFERVELPDAGHFPMREAPQAVSEALVAFFTRAPVAA